MGSGLSVELNLAESSFRQMKDAYEEGISKGMKNGELQAIIRSMYLERSNLNSENNSEQTVLTMNEVVPIKKSFELCNGGGSDDVMYCPACRMRFKSEERLNFHIKYSPLHSASIHNLSQFNNFTNVVNNNIQSDGKKTIPTSFCSDTNPGEDHVVPVRDTTGALETTKTFLYCGDKVNAI